MISNSEFAFSQSTINLQFVMRPQQVESPSSVCVQCGKTNASALYRKFTGGIIQLSQCVRKRVCGLHRLEFSYNMIITFMTDSLTVTK